MSKPKLNLNVRTFDEIVSLALDIKTKMTGNANFTSPTPTLTVIGNLITTAQTKLADWTAAQETAKTKTTERNDAMDALCAALAQLAGYVEAASGGDAAKIQSAGMDVRADRTPSAVPAQAMNLVVTAGDFPGTLDTMCDSQGPAAKTYEWQTSADPMTETTWSTKLTTTKSSATLEGLVTASKTWLRVRALGAAGPGPWSDPAVKVVP